MLAMATHCRWTRWAGAQAIQSEAIAPPMYDAAVTDALDAATVRRLFREHGPMVYRRALRILGNAADAEEALQEVFVRVLRGGEGFEQRSQVTTWLYRITTNYCLNFLRDNKRRRELLETHLSD